MNVKHCESNTSLLYVSSKDHSEWVKALLSHPNIDANLTNKNRKSRIIQAIYYNNIECLKLELSAQGIDATIFGHWV